MKICITFSITISWTLKNKLYIYIDYFIIITTLMKKNVEFGIGMFGDITYDPTTDKPIQTMQERLHQIIEQVQLADQWGVDLFMAGEHHRPDYAISSPEMLLWALSTVTKHITLASGVSIISSSDPVKLYQDFATIDLISNGRAEIVAWRGSFTESFPLFGYDLSDYASLFTEKLDLLLQINQTENLTWSGKHRAAINNQTVLPRALRDGKLPVWIAVGGTPESVLRAAKLGLPIIFAIIGGMWEHFVPMIELYKQEYQKHGHDMNMMQIGAHMHTFIMEDEQQVIDRYFPLYKSQMDRIGKTRWRSSYTLDQFEGGMSQRGALLMGSPKHVANKLALIIQTLGLTRFVAHMDIGGPIHDDMMRSIDVYSREIIPAVKKYFE